jgi:hypothetical protein
MEHPNRWFNHPWVVSFGSAVLAGLVVLYAGQLDPLWVALAVVAFVGVGGIVFGAIKAVRAWREMLGWQTVVVKRLGSLMDEVQAVALAQVIRDAEELGWWVSWHTGGFGMKLTSPNDLRVEVESSLLLPEELAKRLHETDPSHFPSDWHPSYERLAAQLEDQIGSLDRRIKALEDRPKNAAQLKRLTREIAEDRVNPTE